MNPARHSHGLRARFWPLLAATTMLTPVAASAQSIAPGEPSARAPIAIAQNSAEAKPNIDKLIPVPETANVTAAHRRRHQGPTPPAPAVTVVPSDAESRCGLRRGDADGARGSAATPATTRTAGGAGAGLYRQGPRQGADRDFAFDGGRRDRREAARSPRQQERPLSRSQERARRGRGLLSQSRLRAAVDRQRRRQRARRLDGRLSQGRRRRWPGALRIRGARNEGGAGCPTRSPMPISSSPSPRSPMRATPPPAASPSRASATTSITISKFPEPSDVLAKLAATSDSQGHARVLSSAASGLQGAEGEICRSAREDGRERARAHSERPAAQAREGIDAGSARAASSRAPRRAGRGQHRL